MTPHGVWTATPKAAPPEAPANADLLGRDPTLTQRTVTKLGTICLHSARINVGTHYRGATLTILYTADTVALYDPPTGTEIATLERPPEPGSYTNANPPNRLCQPSTRS